MTHRYNFTVNAQWRRAQLRNVAVQTTIALTKQIRENTNAALILFAIYGAGLYIGISGVQKRPAYITAIIIIGALIGLATIARFAFVITNRIHIKEKLNADFKMLEDGHIPPDWAWFCDTLENLYESKGPYAKELFLLVMHNPDSIDISHVPGNGTLAIKYTYKSGRAGSAKDCAKRTFTCSSNDFFSMIDAGKASINLLGEVVDGRLVPTGT